MPNPVDAVTHRELAWPDWPADRDDFRETIAERADERTPGTVLGAVVWGDATDVSNACRRAPDDSLDGVLCDDRALEKAQRFFAQMAQKAFELLLGGRMRTK